MDFAVHFCSKSQVLFTRITVTVLPFEYNDILRDLCRIIGTCLNSQ